MDNCLIFLLFSFLCLFSIFTESITDLAITLITVSFEPDEKERQSMVWRGGRCCYV